MKINTDEHVLPRPVERLPEYANAKSRHTLAERLKIAFALTAPSAAAIANGVVDPSDVRRKLGSEPTNPEVERISVPGGTILGIRTSVWARRIMPDPRNPRILPARKHPFAVDPGSGGEDSKFRPLSEPVALTPDRARAELAVDIESRHQLVWASQQAAGYVLAENDWRESIASQGVMEAVWLVATTYRHADGSDPAVALTTAEGSSRATAVHYNLSIVSADVPYDDNEARLRSRIRKLNEALDRGETDAETQVGLRCETIPALILVGFIPHSGSATEFPTALKSLVALRHVDPPKPWGEGPENESLADEVLDELARRGLISPTQRDYFGGSITRAEAAAAHLSDDPVRRAAEIVKLFSSTDARFTEAIRVAVTSQSTRKRMSWKLMNDLATALILRAVADDRPRIEQLRKYLRQAFGKSVHRGGWNATGRSTDELRKAASEELRTAIAEKLDEPGPATVELAVRSAYPLIVTGRLNADRGTINNDQPDRRTPGEVLDAMRRSPKGILQLCQALHDYSHGRVLRAVDEEGKPRIASNGDEVVVSDALLRNDYPPAGKAKAPQPGDTPLDRYEHAVSELANAFGNLERCFGALMKVRGTDDMPIVDSRGVETRLTDAWRELLSNVDEEIVVWARAYRKTYGSNSRINTIVDADADRDPYENADEEAEDFEPLN